MKVILDTNFILSCVKNKIQIFDMLYDFIIPCEVIEELESIKVRGNFRDRGAASLALELIKNVKAEKVKVGDNVDEGIINLARKRECAVASLDKELRRKLGRGRFMIIRGKKKIEII